MKIIADENIPFVKQCFASIGQVETVSGRDISADIIRDADVLIVRSITKVDEKLLATSKVKFVGTATIGFEHIDIDYLKRNNIGFASAPGSNANSVAEYVIAALLELAEKYNINLEGKTIGIIGVGNVGSRVEQKCKAIGMIPILNDPPLYRQTGDNKYRPLEEIYSCDFITLHTPLTYTGPDKTYRLANEHFFEHLQASPVFINTSRGAVVDSDALKRAIKTGKLKATVLDVWENEPAIDTELLEMVDIGTAHIAGYSYDGKVTGMIMIYEAVCKFFGIQPRYRLEDFLPEPAIHQIELNLNNHPDEQLIRTAVRQIYDIKQDDTALRQILNMPLGQRCATFDKLRKEYPIRREFHNTEIILTGGKSQTLTAKLIGLGFRKVVSK